ncbi:MAG: type II toxin-antitoxin system VapC family toxin [Rhizobiaceae bacterium]
MRITADTNLLVRIIVKDDPVQAGIAYELVSTAQRVMVPLPCLCEVVWVLGTVYGFDHSDLIEAVRTITDPDNSVYNEEAVEAGLHLLSVGGDFADGVIAAAGAGMGAETFVSFDRKAVARVREIGITAKHPGEFA